MRERKLDPRKVAHGIGLAFLLLAVASASAYAIQWQPIGPSGGDRFELKISPADNDTLFVYGHRAIHRSTNGGVTWSLVSTPEMIYGNTFLSLAFDPTQPQNIYVAGSQRGVWSSSDGGSTWQQCSNGIPMTGVSAYVQVSSIICDASGVLYIGITEPSPPLEVPPAAVYRSNDGGATWVAYDDGITLSEQTLTQPVSVLLSKDASNNIWATVYGGGVFRLEQGQWTAHNGNLPESALRATYLAHDSNAPGHMLLATEDAWIFESLNSGVTWAVLGQPGELASVTVLPLVYFVEFDPNNSEHFVVRANDSTGSVETPIYRPRTDQQEGSGLYICFDATRTWYRQTGFVFRITFDPSTTVETEIPGVGPVLRSAITYLTSVGAYCVMKSSDGGLNFDSSIDGIETMLINAVAIWPDSVAPTNSLVYAGAESGIYIKEFSGYEWKRQQAVNDHLYLWSFSKDFANSGAILYGTGNPAWSFATQRGIYRTDLDCISSLDPVCPPGEQLLSNIGVWKVATSAAAPSKIYAACQEAGVLLSADSGQTWGQVNDGFSLPMSVTDLVLDAAGAPLYASTRAFNGDISSSAQRKVLGVNEPGAVFAFNQQQQQWEPLDGITAAVMALEFDAADNILFAATAQGLYRSEDGGLNWQQFGSDKSFRDVAVAPSTDGLVYAACSNGIYRSFDSGLTWQEINDGLQVVDVNQLAIDAETGIVYAATAGASTYMLVPDLNPQPQIVSDPSSLDFGTGYVGEEEALSVVIKNLGEAPLTITNAYSNRAVITVGGVYPQTVVPGDFVQIPVVFAPTVNGLINGTITFASNDPLMPILQVAVTGTGVTRIAPVPDIRVNGKEGTITIYYWSTARITLSLTPGGYNGWPAEYYVKAETPLGVYWYVMGQRWVKSTTPLVGKVDQIRNISSYMLDSGYFPQGTYVLRLFIDTGVDNVFNPQWSDSVTLIIR